MGIGFSSRRRFIGALGAAAAVGLLAACGKEPAPIGRPQYGQDAQHTGRSAHAGPRAVKLLRTFDTNNPGVETPEPGWTPDIQSSAAIGPDGMIYIGNYSGNVFALRDPASGDKL